MSKKIGKSRRSPLFERIQEILESARSNVARTVNSTQVLANWSIGREIVEEEQWGERRAGYGQALLKELSDALQARFGRGYSVDNLEAFRKFFLIYPMLVESVATIAPKISETPSRKLAAPKISETPSRKLAAPAVRDSSAQGRSGAIWRPGQLHPGLSWSHYRALLKVERPEARAFYEIEAAGNNWGVREMERQIGSLLYERLALSKDKKGLLRLAKKGQEIQNPMDVFKDPMVIEFVGLPESPKLVETDLEEALISNLHAFLLELGKGFAFIKRQQRITLDGDHFYIGLVFYHTILKCYILIDLKTEKLTHKDLGQLQLYVNYYDCECLTEGDNPTLERGAKRWFRRAKGQFQMFFKVGHDHQEYMPNFVAETDDRILMIEVKSGGMTDDAIVLAKRDAGVKWCSHATEYSQKHGGKRWVYVFVPHDVVAENMTLGGLVGLYAVTS